MKKKYQNFQKSNNMGNKVADDFPISSRMPLPIKGVEYKDLLKLMTVLENLPVGSSFPIKKELDYAVRKLRDGHFHEYKITVRNVGGDLNRVFRVA